MIRLGIWEIVVLFFALIIVVLLGYVFVNGIISIYRKINNKKD
jgi:hypothetical protein